MDSLKSDNEGVAIFDIKIPSTHVVQFSKYGGIGSLQPSGINYPTAVYHMQISVASSSRIYYNGNAKNWEENLYAEGIRFCAAAIAGDTV